MRVFEITFQKPLVHTKAEADAYWMRLRENYGHIGEQIVGYVVQNRAEVVARVQELVRYIDTAADIKSSERFWSAIVASVVAAAEISQKLGLLAFDPRTLLNWSINYQIPAQRGVVVQQYSGALGTLTDYLEYISGDLLVTSQMQEKPYLVQPLRHPRGHLLGHYDVTHQTLWLLKKGFRDWCLRTGAPFLKILEELHQPSATETGVGSRIISNTHTRKVLGVGTDYAKAQSWCFSINMAHPEIVGVVDPTPQVEEKPRGLKLVKG
jgi:hypothetical protein